MKFSMKVLHLCDSIFVTKFADSAVVQYRMSSTLREWVQVGTWIIGVKCRIVLLIIYRNK
jgi:hypothetical protein